MDIAIYQINMERGEELAFMDLERVNRIQGHTDINCSVYDKVFEGSVNAQGLKDIWYIFNLEHPDYFKGRSLSISDVVEMRSEADTKSVFYFCDSFGFKEVAFDPEKTKSLQHSSDYIQLSARLGITLQVTRDELKKLKENDLSAEKLFISLFQSDRCKMSGDTYFPEPWNEGYLDDDLNFDLPEAPLSVPEKKKPTLDEQIQNGQEKAASLSAGNEKGREDGPDR